MMSDFNSGHFFEMYINPRSVRVDELFNELILITSTMDREELEESDPLAMFSVEQLLVDTS